MPNYKARFRIFTQVPYFIYLEKSISMNSNSMNSNSIKSN